MWCGYIITASNTYYEDKSMKLALKYTNKVPTNVKSNQKKQFLESYIQNMTTYSFKSFLLKTYAFAVYNYINFPLHLGAIPSICV